MQFCCSPRPTRKLGFPGTAGGSSAFKALGLKRGCGPSVGSHCMRPFFDSDAMHLWRAARMPPLQKTGVGSHCMRPFFDSDVMHLWRAARMPPLQKTGVGSHCMRPFFNGDAIHRPRRKRTTSRKRSVGEAFLPPVPAAKAIVVVSYLAWGVEN